MIDKKKELENLENKYKEIKKLNLEISSIITEIKNDVEINRENELLEEKAKLENILKSLGKKLELQEKELKDLKNSNTVLMEELRETKKVRRMGEVKKFQLFAAEKVNVELEEKMTKRLVDYNNWLTEKIKGLEKDLMGDFYKDAAYLNNELKELTKNIKDFMEKSAEKVTEKKEYLQEQTSIFHNKIVEEMETKEGDFLFEKEKTRFIFEKLVGLKGFNFLGIISIFLGVFLVFRTHFIKILANNYVKSGSSYLLGMIFLFAGEKFYQKKKRHFAVGLIGGGIGILYLTTLLSTLYLGLFPMTVGLIISVILTGLVIVLAFRYNSQIIGILAMIGGYLPYGTYIWINRTNIQIYYILAYSIILQGIVLGISWKKDWVYNKILGFMIGIFNMAGLVYYLNDKMHDKLTAFFYIVILTTAYSYIFLNSHKKENRDSDFTDYMFLSLNLVMKFSLIYSLFDETTPSWMKTVLVGGVGIIYGFIGDRLKENKVAKIFYIVALGCFILIIPLIVSTEYLVLAWGLETVFLYLIYKKYNSTELKYGTIVIYIITLFSNFAVREEKFFLVYIQDLMIIFFSFAVYFLMKKSYKKSVKIYAPLVKYCVFLYSIGFINRIIYKIMTELKNGEYYKLMLISAFVTVLIVREVTYKVKKLQDKASLAFLAIIEIVYLININLLNVFWDFFTSETYFLTEIKHSKAEILLIFINIFLFMTARNDIHFWIFKRNEKNVKWIFGESIYILVVSYIILKYSLRFEWAGLGINTIGLLMCGYLVWKGFKVPNRNIRRIGLGIGIFFVMKSFFVDFVEFATSYRLIAYFSMGAILIGTSYIYQTALKKLEQESKNIDNKTFTEKEEDKENKKDKKEE